MTGIWVTEQLDPSGLMYACIACRDESQATVCQESFENNLTAHQKATGWVARKRQVPSWDEVPVNSLKLG
jgi:hypothetical protein